MVEGGFASFNITVTLEIPRESWSAEKGKIYLLSFGLLRIVIIILVSSLKKQGDSIVLVHGLEVDVNTCVNVS